MTDQKSDGRGGLWAALRKPSAKYSVLGLLSFGFFAGVIFWGGFNTGMEAANTLEFCVSCHEMRDTVYQEYKQTTHYANRSGVRATCSDCHVPRDWVHKMARKIQSSQELYGKLMGTISTPEKFEAKRLELARHEWQRMKSSDSRECRNCHSLESMNTELQKQRARKEHELAQRDKQTCIECHKGIAHKKPQGMTEEDEAS
jgi:cytochrome c-type protein NapC